MAAEDATRHHGVSQGTRGCVCARPTKRSRGPAVTAPLLGEPSQVRKRVVGDVFVVMDCLGMLAEIIETGECSTAMARKWPFASVFPVRKVSRNVTALRSKGSLAIPATLHRYPLTDLM
jgi:hypothetical protein